MAKIFPQERNGISGEEQIIFISKRKYCKKGAI
jgi:hypothetical protein